MPTNNLDTLLSSVFSWSHQINNLSLRHIKQPVFGLNTLYVKSITPAELGFMKISSWLYAQYYESGKIGVKFLIDRFEDYGIDSNSQFKNHYYCIGRLRTLLQHSLNPLEADDLETQKFCENWFRSACGDPNPRTDKLWKLCLYNLLTEAEKFFEVLHNCLYKIQEDDNYENIISRWKFELNRYHPPHQYTKLIQTVAYDIGQESVDADKLCKRFYDSWSKKLKNLTGDYNFEIEARKLIERALIFEMQTSFPITGKDIMERFNLPTGKIVGDILKRANFLYEDNPCRSEELLTVLALDDQVKMLLGQYGITIS
jgi:hypothetical protein